MPQHDRNSHGSHASAQVSIAMAGGDVLTPASLAAILLAEIQSDRIAVGQKLPSEPELQKRFGASRYAVREAMRLLRDQGHVWSRNGVGTVVVSKEPSQRQMRGEGSIRELIQFAEANWMQVLERGVQVADRSWVDRYGGTTGEEWAWARVLRRLPEKTRPVAIMDVYVRPEHAEALDIADTMHQPIFSLLQQRFAVQIAEVRQQIESILLSEPDASALHATVGSAALLISRQYKSPASQMLLLSVGRYPAGRFVHDTRFRVGT